MTFAAGCVPSVDRGLLEGWGCRWYETLHGLAIDVHKECERHVVNGE